MYGNMQTQVGSIWSLAALMLCRLLKLLLSSSIMPKYALTSDAHRIKVWTPAVHIVQIHMIGNKLRIESWCFAACRRTPSSLASPTAFTIFVIIHSTASRAFSGITSLSQLHIQRALHRMENHCALRGNITTRGSFFSFFTFPNFGNAFGLVFPLPFPFVLAAAAGALLPPGAMPKQPCTALSFALAGTAIPVHRHLGGVDEHAVHGVRPKHSCVGLCGTRHVCTTRAQTDCSGTCGPHFQPQSQGARPRGAGPAWHASRSGRGLR